MPTATYKELTALLDARGLPRLWPPYNPDGGIIRRLHEINPQDLFTKPITDPDMAASVVSGLILMADGIEQSHRLSQDIATTTGSYWHGIMHRREPDYANSRYWFNRVGNHPAFGSVFESVIGSLEADDQSGDLLIRMREWGRWQPELFISLVESAERKGPLVRPLEIAQYAEMKALLAWCHSAAVK